jgi:hypothetical protein
VYKSSNSRNLQSNKHSHLTAVKLVGLGTGVLEALSNPQVDKKL